MGNINENMRINGQLSMTSIVLPNTCINNAHIGAAAAIERSKLAQELAAFTQDLTGFRVHDAVATVLPGTAADDDLALIGGTFGTHSIAVRSGDLKAAGATTRYARREVILPAEYQAGQTVKLRFSAGMLTTVSDGTATLDVEAYKNGEDALVDGGDLCTTAAQDINSLTFADKDFVITPDDLEPGDKLDVRIAIAVNDSSSGTAVEAAIGTMQLLCDVKG